MPNPLISWGIIIASLGSLEDNIKEAKEDLGIHNALIGVDFPYEQQVFPAIVVGINSLEVRNAGLYSAELTTPRTQELMSYGEVSLTLWAVEHNHLMTLVDYLSKAFLLNYFEQNRMAFPGTDRHWVSMGYAGGSLTWSPFQLQNMTYTGATYERLYTTSTSMKFKGEHGSTIDLATVSGVSIEAIPLNRIV